VTLITELHMPYEAFQGTIAAFPFIGGIAIRA
jgi:hypothetical protein